MYEDGMTEADPKEILKGEVQEFLSEFEASEETEDAMKTILPIWRDGLINHSHEVGGGIDQKIKTLLNVCEDYANNLGMLERVRQEAEEIRITLNL